MGLDRVRSGQGSGSPCATLSTIVRKVLVCGVGLMGHGIAQVMAAAGHIVRVYEPDVARADAGVQRIAGNLQRVVDKGRIGPEEGRMVLARISIAETIAKGAKGVDLAIEAAFEDEAVKRDLFGRLDVSAPARTILATNTSSISIGRLAEAVKPARRAKVVGMHFFSPVPVMPLVELVLGPETSRKTESEARAIAAELGKQVIVSADRPGFLVNRILMPFLAEAMRLFQEGTGTAEDIDAGAKVGLNHPMGPLELADFVGLDVCLSILNVLHEGLGGSQFEAPLVLRELVEAGHLGQKTRRGFYTYPRD
jgi:3-hydroxybutyryl-CoA dehydrogenase